MKTLTKNKKKAAKKKAKVNKKVVAKKVKKANNDLMDDNRYLFAGCQ